MTQPLNDVNLTSNNQTLVPDNYNQYMNRQDLDRLDYELDQHIPKTTLQAYKLDRLLSHLLYLVEIGEKTSLLERLDHGAIEIAILWAYSYCKPLNLKKIDTNFDLPTLECSLNLYHLARHFSAVSDIMRLLYNGKLGGRRKNNNIETDLLVPFDVGLAATESELFGATDPLMILPDNRVIAGNFNTCKRVAVGNLRIKYTHSPALFQSVLSVVKEAGNATWLLDPNFDVGGYSLADYRCFAETLAAFAQVHHYVSAASPLQSMSLKHIAFNSLLKIDTKPGWVKLLAQLSNLPLKTVAMIIEDISFNPLLYGHKKPKPELMAHPFFPLSKELLMLSNRIAFESNMERNFWKLLSIKKPQIHRQLSLKKEQLQIDELEKILSNENRQLKLLPRLKVEKLTDLDFLVLDIDDKFGLALQLKWHYGPARHREIDPFCDELQGGIQSITKAMPWLRSIPQVVIQKSQLTKEQLQEFRFEGMVLSKNSIGFGWLDYRKDIPITSERFLRWALLDQRVSLRRFWELSAEYAFKLKENVHYRAKTITATFGGIALTASIAFNVIRTFDPAKEIKWSK